MTIVDKKDGWNSYGYVWIINKMLTKRWRSSVTPDGEATKRLLQEIRDFCENKDGKLEEFEASLSGNCGIISNEDYVFE